MGGHAKHPKRRRNWWPAVIVAALVALDVLPWPAVAVLVAAGGGVWLVVRRSRTRGGQLSDRSEEVRPGDDD